MENHLKPARVPSGITPSPLGAFDGVVETPRIRVTLTTGIPEERCRRVDKVLVARALGSTPHGEKFGYRRKSLGSAADGDKLGCSLYEVPPGRRAWPYHYHLANEEAIYVMEGSGTLRIGGEELLLSEGAYVALPRGRKVRTSSSTPRRRC